jgi:ribonucleoside-diphosphate reductase alpha subunit
MNPSNPLKLSTSVAAKYSGTELVSMLKSTSADSVKYTESELIKHLTSIVNAGTPQELFDASLKIFKCGVPVQELLKVREPPQPPISFTERPRFIFRMRMLRELYKWASGSSESTSDPRGANAPVPDTLRHSLLEQYREPILPTIEELTNDLDVNKAKLIELLENPDLLEIARQFGSDLIKPDHRILAGRLLLLHNLINSFECWDDYLDYFDINTETSTCLREWSSELDALIWANIGKIFTTDFFAAGTTHKMYLLKADFNLPVRENILQLYIRVAAQLWGTSVRRQDHLGRWIKVTPKNREPQVFVKWSDPFGNVNEVVDLLNHLNPAPSSFLPENGMGPRSLSRLIRKFYSALHKITTQATPTLCNAGTQQPQMASCFMHEVEDNLESIMEVGVKDTAIIEKYDGGIGLWVSKLRHSSIRNRYEAEGVVPMLYVIDRTVQYIKRSQGKRGALNAVIRPYHIDIFDFLKAFKRDGDPKAIFWGIHGTIWMPRLFFKRLSIPNSTWTLFCPKYVSLLNDRYGDDFEALYEYYEHDPSIPDRYKKIVKTVDLHDAICSTILEQGFPFMMNADAVNEKSNQRHQGAINGTNLCTEIAQRAKPGEISSCNLGQQGLVACARGEVFACVTNPDGTETRYSLHQVPNSIPQTKIHYNLTEAYDFDLLGETSGDLVEDINATIDYNWYPLDERDEDGNVIQLGKIHRPNLDNRPEGIGMSGFADALGKMNLPFRHPATEKLNELIGFCRYFNAVARTIQEAIEYGPCAAFEGSPASEGKFQFDLWAEETARIGTNPYRQHEDDRPVDPHEWGQKAIPLYRLEEDQNGCLRQVQCDVIEPNWESLREKTIKYGWRNIHLIAEMPTATTSQYLGNAEAMEPHQSCMYTRQVVIGEYAVIPRYLSVDLQKAGVWNEYTFRFIQKNEGCLTGFTEFIKAFREFYPDEVDFALIKWIETKYLTVWEISQDLIGKYAARRARATDQAQSLNLHRYACTAEDIKLLHTRNYQRGLKNLHYYMRNKPDAETTKFSIPPWFNSMLEQRKFKINVRYEQVNRTRNTKVVCVGCT